MLQLITHADVQQHLHCVLSNILSILGFLMSSLHYFAKFLTELSSQLLLVYNRQILLMSDTQGCSSKPAQTREASLPRPVS